MKRLILLFISVVAIFTPAYAEKISQQDARNIAEDFFRKNGKKAVLILENGTPATKSTIVEPAYYVYNNINGSGGFVIVSGDDSSRQILAYSLSGHFDSTDMPDNVAFWMKSMEESIREAKKIQHSATTGSSSWYEKVLQTATWDQGEPYNNMCPIVNGSKSVTGCVATATAIVMRYHKWPETGVGYLPDYINSSDNNNIQPGHALGHSYDWDHMPLNLTLNSSEQEIKAVSQLMFDIGVMLEMHYSPIGSGTGFDKSKLIRHMKYDPFMAFLWRGEPEERSFSDSEWFSIIQQEIDANRPIIYGGYSGGGGHEFVVDGYNSEGYIHINWGWGPSSIGFYALDNMSYNHEQSMIVGIKPYKDKIPEEFTICYDGIEFSVWDDYDVISIHTDWHEQFYRGDCDCEVAFGKVGKDGKLKEIIWQQRLSDSNSQNAQFSKTRNYNFGDYVMPFFRPFGESKWRPMVFSGQYNAIEKLPLFDKSELEKRTRVSYDKQTRLFEVASDEYAVYDLLDDSGTNSSGLLKAEKGKSFVSIDKLPSRCCTIRVSLSGHSIDLHIIGGAGTIDQNGTESIRKGETIEW